MEGSHSGLVRLLGEQLCPSGHRGFESHPLRPSLGKNMYYVYILKSNKDDNLYIGYTNDLRRRLKEHNTSFSKATKSRLPLELVYYEAYL